MTPLSSNPKARAKQLANLTPAPPAPPLGNGRARRHGGYSEVARPRLDAKVREIFDAIALDAPLRDPDGGLARPDAAQVRLLAASLCRLEAVESYLDAHGYLTEDGDTRPAAELEVRLRREAADYLDAMGMTPRSRAKLGLDLAHGFDLALAMAEDAEAEDAERQRAEADDVDHVVDVDDEGGEGSG